MPVNAYYFHVSFLELIFIKNTLILALFTLNICDVKWFGFAFSHLCVQSALKLLKLK